MVSASSSQSRWSDEVKKVALLATCRRVKCGAIIVKDGEIIGTGYNSPPGNSETERRCKTSKSEYDQKVTDKTCCVHAEQRAIMDALSRHANKLSGSQMYFIGFRPNGELRLDNGKIKLYCTICTKMMFDVGISEFILMSSDGFVSYSADAYNRLSYGYSPELSD